MASIELVQVGSNDPKLGEAFNKKLKENFGSFETQSMANTMRVQEIFLEGLSELSIRQLALEVRKDWKKVNYAAEPYLAAMSRLDSINDRYYEDSGKSIVTYFLGNATSWRGETAKAVKAELNRRLKA